MSDLPLDETALRVAHNGALNLTGGSDAYDRELISTYLRGARFETQIDDASKHGYDGPKTHRLVGPWVPVVQAESEDE